MVIERTNNTIRNMIWGYIDKVLSMLLPFILRTVMIYVLGAGYLGINSLFTSILQVLNLSELGFGVAIVYSMYKPIAENDDEKICALLSFFRRTYLIIGLVILTIGSAILPFITILIRGDYPPEINIYYVYFLFLLNTSISYFLFAYRSSLLSAFQRNDVISKTSIISNVVRYTLEVIIIYYTRYYYFYLYIGIGTTILNNIIKYYYTKKYYPSIKCKGTLSKEERKVITNNVYAIMFHKIGGIVLNSADNIVISAFMGLVMLAKYANYYYIMNAIEGIIIIIFTGMIAGIGNSFVTETIEKNKMNFKKVLFFNGWIVGFCSICLACLYQDFMELWVGTQFMFEYYIVVLIVLYFFIHSIRRTIISFRDGAGMWQDNKWQPIVSAVFNLIVNVILVQRFGIVGILLSSIMAMTIIDIPWETVAFCRKIQMKSVEYILLILKYFILTVFSCIITYYACSFIKFDLIINIALKLILCIIIGNMIFWLFLKKSDEYSYFKELLKKKIRIRRTNN